MTEIIKLNNNRSPENKSKAGAVLILVVIIIAIVFGVAFIPECNSEEIFEDKLEVYNITMDVDYTEYLGYSCTIRGTAKNTSNHSYSYASVEFSVYDSAGNNLGTALANVNNLGAGDTWRFEAVLFEFPSSRPASYKLVDIITW